MQVTIRDVAKASGVSPSTVSRALAPGGAVSPVTRERVRAAADRLGHQPNQAARGLITGRTAPQVDGIVLCSPQLSGEELGSLGDFTDKPIVLLHRKEPGFGCVAADLVEGMTDALTHLHALGHRRIAYAGGPRGSWAARERAAGVEAVAASGLVEIVQVGCVAPPLTTVPVPKAHGARAAVDPLCRMPATPAAEGEQPPQRVLLVHLVVRGSTAALDRR
ncbi:LacI family DNA-binding transcriptional regulator [Streptomyces sp. NPDC059679]|uniref:LacI family DNA-binding transcriptional regulator n=1 Tax=Streptomyces sp. NPDC059679 TaxID=3346903 RepID=UPI0036B37296